MHEIKFRGRRKNSSEWVYGAFLSIPKLCSYIYDVQPDGQATRYLVDEDTVGQFTGLRDSNGKEIYEGDILSLREGSDEMIQVIDFYAAITALDLSEMMNLRLLSYYFERKEVHVIGNIYDNPELLEATE